MWTTVRGWVALIQDIREHPVTICVASILALKASVLEVITNVKTVLLPVVLSTNTNVARLKRFLKQPISLLRDPEIPRRKWI
jgi:hypothetical protein